MNASKVRRNGQRKNRKNDWKSLTDGSRTDSKNSTNGLTSSLRKNGRNGWKKNGCWAYCQFPFFFVNFYTESITYRFSSHTVVIIVLLIS